MRRTRRWLVIFAALMGLMAHAGALRATSLIFGKGSTSTTTTTTTTTTSPESPTGTEVETTEPSVVVESNNSSSKSTLTGIPQIDYIWDPNLPRELNGYNLSEYPFYSTVPPNEEIDFKCEGLHDGFYAAIKHKCQLYHHCIDHVRYDFLCANYTAFDQKTFICQFVSVVDCKNSAKYFHRNDALYVNPTTTTTTTTTTPAPSTTAAMRPRPAGPRRRPLHRRRRPQVDYSYYDEDYDFEYYEDRRNRRRKQRPRTRRPDYDDDYDERSGYSEDDKYDKRPYNRDRVREDSDDYDYDRRKPAGGRSRNRSSGENRRSNEEDRPDRHKYSERRKENEDRRLPTDERRSENNDRRNIDVDDRRSLNDERLYKKERTKFSEDNEEESGIRIPNGRKRPNGRPIYDDNSGDARPRRRDEERPLRKDRDEERPLRKDRDEERPLRKDRDEERPLRKDRDEERPLRKDRDEDRPFRKDRDEDRPLRQDRDDEEDDIKTKKDDDKSLVKPSGSSGLSSLFGPRVPPKISRPVPLTERKKYEYVTKKTTTSAPLTDEEYYDDYEDEPPRKIPAKEENLEKSDSFAPRRPFSLPGKQDQRTRYETVPDGEEKGPEKTSANPSLFKHRESSRRPFFTQRGKDNLRNRNENIRENEEQIEEQPDISSNFKQRDQSKRFSTPSERQDSRNIYEEDNTRSDRDDRSENPSLKSKYKPMSRNSYRGPAKKDNSAEDEEEQESKYKERSQNSDKIVSSIRFGSERDGGSTQNIRKDSNQRKEKQRTEPPEDEQEVLSELKQSEEIENISNEDDSVKEIRPIVRIVKRPFLPSRGGSPYLPRGLQSVGAAQKSHTTESTPIDMGSTVSGVRLLEHAAPIVRTSGIISDDDYPQLHQGPRTTQQPQIDPPKSSLEEIYDNEYDVTLNDALNPTLKPLPSSPNRGYPSGFSHSNKFDNNRFSSPAAGGFSQNGDSYYSSSDVRSSAVKAPNYSRQHSSNSKRSHEYYDDEYDY